MHLVIIKTQWTPFSGLGEETNEVISKCLDKLLCEATHLRNDRFEKMQIISYVAVTFCQLDTLHHGYISWWHATKAVAQEFFSFTWKWFIVNNGAHIASVLKCINSIIFYLLHRPHE